MSLENDIIPYVDGNGLVAPNLVEPGVKRASDNGPLFSSQYIHILNQKPLVNALSVSEAMQAIKKCIDSEGYLHRAPDDTTYGNPDNHYGVLSLGIPVKLPLACYQPALIFLNLMAHNHHFLASFLSPLIGLVIAFSNYKTPKEDVGNRLLTWTLIRGSYNAVWCRLGSYIWYYRMNKVYGPSAMKSIASIYFRDDHPFSKYIE